MSEAGTLPINSRPSGCDDLNRYERFESLFAWYTMKKPKNSKRLTKNGVSAKSAPRPRGSGGSPPARRRSTGEGTPPEFGYGTLLDRRWGKLL